MGSSLCPRRHMRSWPWNKRPAGFVLSVLLVLVSLRSQCEAQSLAPLEPPTGSGAWFGVSIDFFKETVQSYMSGAGIEPVSFGVFVPLPMEPKNRTYLIDSLGQIAKVGGVALITVEPWAGLAAVTDQVIQDFASIITYWEKRGARVMVRFAHEMNGSWYPWGQLPQLYIKTFRRFAQIIKLMTCRTAMVWAPNGGEGYPWGGGLFSDNITPAALEYLDTSGDGKLTKEDDMYTPFYPGDDVVDWVGISIEHFGGTHYPYVKNMRSAARFFSNKLTGINEGGVIPDFYGTFCGANGTHKKPLVITETAAMYSLTSDIYGDQEITVKRTWWEQVFNINGDNANAWDVSLHFPMMKMVMWFDQKKEEGQSANNTIDWRFSGTPTIRNEFLQYLGTTKRDSSGKPFRYWKLLPDFLQYETSNNFSAATCIPPAEAQAPMSQPFKSKPLASPLAAPTPSHRMQLNTLVDEPGAWLAAGPAYASPHDPASQSTWPLSKASRSPGFGPAPAPSPIRAPRKTGAVYSDWRLSAMAPAQTDADIELEHDIRLGLVPAAAPSAATAPSSDVAPTGVPTYPLLPMPWQIPAGVRVDAGPRPQPLRPDQLPDPNSQFIGPPGLRDRQPGPRLQPDAIMVDQGAGRGGQQPVPRLPLPWEGPGAANGGLPDGTAVQGRK